MTATTSHGECQNALHRGLGSFWITKVYQVECNGYNELLCRSKRQGGWSEVYAMRCSTRE